jgi:hypothetical protein
LGYRFDFILNLNIRLGPHVGAHFSLPGAHPARFAAVHRLPCFHRMQLTSLVAHVHSSAAQAFNAKRPFTRHFHHGLISHLACTNHFLPPPHFCHRAELRCTVSPTAEPHPSESSEHRRTVSSAPFLRCQPHLSTSLLSLIRMQESSRRASSSSSSRPSRSLLSTVRGSLALYLLTEHLDGVTEPPGSFFLAVDDREGAAPRRRPPPLSGRRQQIEMEHLCISFIQCELQGSLAKLTDHPNLQLAASSPDSTVEHRRRPHLRPSSSPASFGEPPAAKPCPVHPVPSLHT